MCLVKKVFSAASKYYFWALSFFFFYRYLKAIVTCGISCSSILYIATVKWKNSFDKTNFQKKSHLFIFQFSKYYIWHIAKQFIIKSFIVAFIFTAQLHSIKQELKLCASSNPSRGKSKVGHGENFWKQSQLEINLNAFCRSAILQKQFIIISTLIINIIIIIMKYSGWSYHIM